MTINEGLRMVAGVVVILSVVLAHYVSEYFLLLTGFVGLNLLQSAFTHWCPMMWLLEKIGLKKEIPATT